MKDVPIYLHMQESGNL